MKYTSIRKKFCFFIFAFITFLIFNYSSAFAANAQSIVTQNGNTQKYESSSLDIQYNNSEYQCNISPVKISGTWMIPAKEVFSEILGCYYHDDTENNQLILKNPERTTKIKLSINSKTAIVNEVNKEMPQSVVEAINENSKAVDYLVPLDFLIQTLGFSYSINNSNIVISSNYIYSYSTDNTSFDQSKYENVLEGITIGKNNKNTQNYVLGLTTNTMYSSNVTYAANAKENSTAIKFKKTKNALGTFSKEINNGIITSVKVWESADNATYIKVYYNKKYIYSKKTTSIGSKITLSKGNFSMKVVLPDGITFSKISTTDQYWKKRFLIVIPGNHVNFYKLYPPFKNSSSIKKISVSKTAAGNTRIIVTTSGLKGYKLTKANGSFTVKIGSPKSIYKNIVLLDAGHGGKDMGAKKKGVKEKTLNLNILYTQAKKYFESNSSTVKAYWTRHDDTFVNLYKRPKYSAKYSADLFVSLHMNFASSSKAKGTEVYYSKVNNKKMSGLNSKMFASRMYRTLINDLNSKRRGVKQAGFVVIKNNTVPSILIELGFISNSSDRNKLKRISYQKKAAKSIYRGISNTFKAYPTKR